ncbi:MAG: B12-binding domain-containing radical SAM protein [Anaerocolumna sp.]
MKILLTAINAKYIHSNLAVYSLRSYAKAYKQQIRIAEFTINNYTDDILQAIYKEKPDFIGLSCYIWNISIIGQLCIELRKLLPDLKIWLGGPEVSFDAKKRLESGAAIDGIMIGEGEGTFTELMDYYINGEKSLGQIKGIAFKGSACKSGDSLATHELLSAEKVIITPLRPEMDFSTLPFSYENIADFENKIIYYETSRGCPYSCSYCLSSLDKKVRLRNMELVKEELAVFLKYKVPQVKFVDRTFNCNRSHALAIWQYIKGHDNGITNFHFEISADILEKEEIALLNTMREGLVQLEIGVQSTNPKTIEAIRRRMDFGKLKLAVDQIHKGRNIHEHLDLIAGLPYEDIESFKNSFNEVYALKPDQFQLGFLKVLKGSAMYEESKEWGIVYQSISPYEVLYTRWLSYDDVLALKVVEDMVEIYYNSGQFEYAIKYMEHFFRTPFDLYYALGDYYEGKKLRGINSSRMRRYEILLGFIAEIKETGRETAKEIDIKAFRNILVHDLYLRENLKSRPSFAEEYEQYKKQYRNFYFNGQKLREYLMLGPAEIKTDRLKPYLHLEHYNIDVEKTAETGVVVRAEGFILYDYIHRNKLNAQARTLPAEL